MLNNYPSILFQFIIFLSLFSCSFDYKEAMVDEEISGGTPNAVIINLNETSIKKGTTAYIFKAEKAETYDKKNLTVFTNLQFAEYDKTSGIATEGKVGHANFFSDTENIEFDKSFKIKSIQQSYYIEGESISWDGEKKVLTANPEEEVTVGKDDGSYITGRGFSSTASNNSFNFESGVEGFYVAEDEEEE